MAAPSNPSSGIKVTNSGLFTCRFRVKKQGAETELSGTKLNTSIDFLSRSAVWDYDELARAGFQQGDSCWVSCDVDAGPTNHESSGNFTLWRDAAQLAYTFMGAVWNPSFSGPDSTAAPPPAVVLTNHGGFSCRCRVRTSNGRETQLSHDLSLGSSVEYSFDELVGYGFKEGDDCWVSADIDAGETNHESGRNFTLSWRTQASYSISGGVWNPSWD